ncbi:Putative jacalin-like lectin domain-containing protein [Colletotrichum destructivum]|uniref:Jacalin-like lectin domain-containing protein n=1 Tax=Colletotrichum destructivum TaxID=34406 RepID=A0AAX4I5F1_9PEZI|nr:Putative jacalin-like lectin domain-containing protein [Colletotrichum destructivum]
MAPSILNFRALRRRSKSSFKTDRSNTDVSSDASNATTPTPTSGASTPPSIAQNSDPSLNLQLKDSNHPQARPPLQAVPNSHRQSVSGMTGLGSPVINGKSTLPVSPYAPRIANITENAWVYQKVLLVHGTIGDPSHHSVDGNLSVTRLDDGFPPTSWPVADSHFKALVYLQPGPNKIRFDFSSPKLPNSSSSNPIHASHLTVHMLPANNSPPLQLAIVVAKDSPETFDAVPARIEREGNGLETAVRKFRMAAYLWQAFTAEQMWRNKLGRRVFRFEEEWVPGTSNQRDRDNGTLRSEARIHIIRSDKTVAEIRDLELAQQNEEASMKGDLYGIAAEAINQYFKPLSGQKQYVSVLMLDTQWGTETKVAGGHTALGGNTGGSLQLAIFGSHCLQSYPTSFEEVVPAFTDCTPTDLDFVADNCNQTGSSWETANVGIGAHLHETGHLFGCPHQENGVMLRDYLTLNRSFVTREAYCTRTKSKGGLVLQADECGWHRLDCLRFRAHPCFRLPNDPPMNADDSVHAFPVESGNVVVMAATGIAFIELLADDDDFCRQWIEYPIENGPVQRQLTLNDRELRERLPENKRKGRLRVSVKSHGGGALDIDNFKKLCSKESSFKLTPGPLGKTAYRGKALGNSAMQGAVSQEVVFDSAVKQNLVLSRVILYHENAVNGIEFVYDDDSTQLFGKRGGKEGGDTFEFDIRRGEYISGFYVRSGSWIEAIQILTSLGRRSPVYGNAHGGSAHTLIPPRGYTICGVAGSCGACVDGFSILIVR